MSLRISMGIACLVASMPQAGNAVAQDGAVVEGVVTLQANAEPVHGAIVLVVGLGRFVTTDHEGRFRIENVPEGTYYVLVQREHLSAERREIVVRGGESMALAFSLELSPVHEEITVTTSARGESTALEQFNAVTSLDSFELAKNMSGNIGEVLQNEPGVAKRSFGPAASRPIIRGFDGDRVLIMQDGVRTGDLSSQSGDHNVAIDPANLERIEVIKGPATLLYGSNAVGGIVNTITPQDGLRRSRSEGARGQIVLDAGSANAQAGVNGNVRHAQDGWMMWGAGGGRRTGDYDTPEGRVENSASRLANATAGAGYGGDRAFFSVGYSVEDGRYGVPGAAELLGNGHDDEGELGGDEEFFIDIDQRRQNLRLDFGLREIPSRALESARVIFQLIDWRHDEIEIEGGIENVGTRFENDILLLRAEVEQRRTSRLTGRFGFWAQSRDYVVTGEEALAPPTSQTAVAAFGYEELELGPSTTLSFGGRVEHNGYDPEARQLVEEDEAHGDGEELLPPAATSRSFTGFSGALGVRRRIGRSSAFVVNLSRSYRAPALEELYNFGPHVGNLAFEVGRSELERESTIGIDASLRGRSSNFDGSVNLFYYDIDNFVFPAFEEEIVEGLRLAPFEQGDSRFVGLDGTANVRLSPHLWVRAGVSFVDAKLVSTNEGLPRIPPLHGRVELEIPYGALTLAPEIVWSAEQDEIFRNETVTEGYAVLNFKARYVLARTHAAHIFAVNAYNLTDELYRTHTNFIKDFAAEIGRGVKFTYSFRFF